MAVEVLPPGQSHAVLLQKTASTPIKSNGKEKERTNAAIQENLYEEPQGQIDLGTSFEFGTTPSVSMCVDFFLYFFSVFQYYVIDQFLATTSSDRWLTTVFT